MKRAADDDESLLSAAKRRDDSIKTILLDATSLDRDCISTVQRCLGKPTWCILAEAADAGSWRARSSEFHLGSNTIYGGSYALFRLESGAWNDLQQDIISSADDNAAMLDCLTTLSDSQASEHRITNRHIKFTLSAVHWWKTPRVLVTTAEVYSTCVTKALADDGSSAIFVVEVNARRYLRRWNLLTDTTRDYPLPTASVVKLFLRADARVAYVLFVSEQLGVLHLEEPAREMVLIPCTARASATLSPDGKFLMDEVRGFWRTDNGQLHRVMPGGDISAWSSSGRKVAVVQFGNCYGISHVCVYAWDTWTQLNKITVKRLSYYAVRKLVFSLDETELLFLQRDGTYQLVHLCDLVQNTCRTISSPRIVHVGQLYQ